MNVPVDAWVGAGLPVVIAVLQQHHWPRPLRTAFAAVVCVLAACVLNLAGLSDMNTLAGSVGVVLATAGTLYTTYWAPSGIAPAIDRATTFTKPD